MLGALRDAEETLTLLAREAPPAVPPASGEAIPHGPRGREQALRTPLARARRRPRPRWFPWVFWPVAAGLVAFFSGGSSPHGTRRRSAASPRESASGSA